MSAYQVTDWRHLSTEETRVRFALRAVSRAAADKALRALADDLEAPDVFRAVNLHLIACIAEIEGADAIPQAVSKYSLRELHDLNQKYRHQGMTDDAVFNIVCEYLARRAESNRREES